MGQSKAVRQDQTGEWLIRVWFVIVYGLAVLNPVYTDEIAYEYMLGRFFRDDGGQFFMWPECSSFHQAVPFIWQIPRSLVAAVYHVVPNLFALRLLGFGFALSNAYLLFRILSAFFPQVSRRVVALFLLSLTAGVFPFLAVMMRPEGFLVFFALASIAGCQMWGSRRPAIAAVAVFGGSLLASSSHPLGIAELPLFLACLWSLRTRTRCAAPFILLVVLYAAVSIPLYDRWLRCDENPAVANFLKQYRGGPFTVDALPMLLLDLPRRGIDLFHFIVNSLSPLPGYMSGIVPRRVWGELSYTVRIGIGLVLMWLLAFCWFIVRALTGAVRSGHLRERIASFPGVVGLGAFCSLLALLSMQPFLLPYRLSFIMPVLILLVGLLGFSSFYRVHPTACLALNARVGRLAVASSLVSLLAYLPLITARVGQVTTELQPHSTNHLAAWRPSSMDEIVSQCGLQKGAVFRRLFVDEHTYWLFRNSQEPVFFTYTGYAGHPLPAHELWRRLVAAEADGLVIHCASAQRMLGTYTDIRRVDDLCCLNKGEIASLAQ